MFQSGPSGFFSEKQNVCLLHQGFLPTPGGVFHPFVAQLRRKGLQTTNYLGESPLLPPPGRISDVMHLKIACSLLTSLPPLRGSQNTSALASRSFCNHLWRGLASFHSSKLRLGTVERTGREAAMPLEAAAALSAAPHLQHHDHRPCPRPRAKERRPQTGGSAGLGCPALSRHRPGARGLRGFACRLLLPEPPCPPHRPPPPPRPRSLLFALRSGRASAAAPPPGARTPVVGPGVAAPPPPPPPPPRGLERGARGGARGPGRAHGEAAAAAAAGRRHRQHQRRHRRARPPRRSRTARPRRRGCDDTPVAWKQQQQQQPPAAPRGTKVIRAAAQTPGLDRCEGRPRAGGGCAPRGARRAGLRRKRGARGRAGGSPRGARLGRGPLVPGALAIAGRRVWLWSLGLIAAACPTAGLGDRRPSRPAGLLVRGG